MENFTPFSSMVGGLLIGLAATLLLWANGRIAGISGILSGIRIPIRADNVWRICFIAGLLLAPIGYMVISGRELEIATQVSPTSLIIAGLAVGFGTKLGSGCTSGHGICGIARFSGRSLLATATFMGCGIVTVYVTRHLVGAL